MIELRPADRGAALRAFIAYPYERYRGVETWVPPLRCVERRRIDRRRNPFFQHADSAAFLAVHHGRIAGRIMAIDDRAHHARHADGAAAFGFFEAAHEEAARALLAGAERWARERGRTMVRGPLSPSLNDMSGLLVEGFADSPSLMMPFNPPEYGQWIERAGYRKAKDLLALDIDLGRAAPFDRLAHLAERVRGRGVTIRPIDERRLAEEFEAFAAIYERAWAGNWGFVPPTADERNELLQLLRLAGDARYVLAAEVKGTLAGFLIGIPDINQALAGTSGRLTPRTLWRLFRGRRRITRGRVLLCGVLPEFRRLGLLGLLVRELFERGTADGFRSVECSWVLEDNADMIGPIEALGGRRSKVYRVFEKAL